MNQINQYIFNLYHYLLTLRDTLEYTIERDHDVNLYEQRKTILTKGMQSGSALGNFLENNKENGEKIKAKLEEFVDDVYGDASTILTVSGDKVRVDHTQHIKIFDYVTGLSESIRDIIYGYINHSRQINEYEALNSDLILADDHLYRGVLVMLVLRDFEKSFAEFQKVMAESQGKPTPQSNFIVQNEIVKMAGFIRFSRAHCHCIDNETLDLLDEVNATIEMTEGRRERRDGKSFKEIFDAINQRVNAHVGKFEPLWKEVFAKALEEAKQAAAKASEAAAA